MRRTLVRTRAQTRDSRRYPPRDRQGAILDRRPCIRSSSIIRRDRRSRGKGGKTRSPSGAARVHRARNARHDHRRVRSERSHRDDARPNHTICLGARGLIGWRSVSASVGGVMRLKSSRATFEPVSAKTQPVSGPATCPISDIENSRRRDSSRKKRPSIGNVRFSSPETRPMAANPRKCRHFSEPRKFLGRDPGVWLTMQSARNSSPTQIPC